MMMTSACAMTLFLSYIMNGLHAPSFLPEVCVPDAASGTLARLSATDGASPLNGFNSYLQPGAILDSLRPDKASKQPRTAPRLSISLTSGLRLADASSRKTDHSIEFEEIGAGGPISPDDHLNPIWYLKPQEADEGDVKHMEFAAGEAVSLASERPIDFSPLSRDWGAWRTDKLQGQEGKESEFSVRAGFGGSSLLSSESSDLKRL